MILLILFYLAMVIAAGLLIAFGISFYLNSRQISAPEDQRYITGTPNLRPLFAPSADDVREQEHIAREAEKELGREKEREAHRQELSEKVARAKDFQAVWQGAPERSSAGELFRLAAMTGSVETYSEISKNVIQIWHDKKIAGLTAAELAGLLDSHLRLLPQQEMASGALFWLKQEIAALRNEAEKNNLQG
jgi:hypothetical protein